MDEFKKGLKKYKEFLTTWSPSAYADWSACARKAFYKRVAKLPEGPIGPPLIRGKKIHKEAEDYILKGGNFPESLKLVGDVLEGLRTRFLRTQESGRVKVEWELAFNRKWEVCSWFGSETWARFKLDVCVLPGPADGVAEVIDWKTGKYKPGTYVDQLELYGLAVLQSTKVERVETELIFTDVEAYDPCDTSGVVVREGLEMLKAKWEMKIKVMEADRTFAPCPSFACRWCPYTKGKGGPCQF